MAFSNQDIIAAYNQRGGASEAEFATWANSQGVSNDQLLSARSELVGSAPAPVASPVAAPAADRWTDQQYTDFRNWSSGKDLNTILAKGQEVGATADELGKAFGQYGGTGEQVKAASGYGGAVLGDADKWSFNTQSGWTKKQETPKTGINLSQLQGTTSWDVSPNQTVQTQLEQIIAADSPLMQQARARALQAANERGLLNSSMAVTAGQSALYDAAMPIAQQDASTYADAGRFNADASNTFSRDNNAFVRDSFMADFNLSANEWAKQQDQLRTFAQMDYTQKQTLERDAIQNGYTSARDAILNGYQVARDETTNTFTLKRDDKQNQFTAGQQDKQNTYAATEAEKDRTAAYQRSVLGVSAPAADTSVQRTQMQITADARNNLATLKTEWAGKIVAINTGDYTPEQKGAALTTLTSAYAPIAESYAVAAGLDPTTASLGLRYEAQSAAPAPTTNVVQNVTQGGDGG